MRGLSRISLDSGDSGLVNQNATGRSLTRVPGERALRMRVIEGALRAVHVPGRPESPAVVLCHGFGANALDLASLSALAPELNWYFPQAPLAVGPENFAWFPLVAEELARLKSQGITLDFEDVVPPGLGRSREALFDFIAETGIAENLILGGFSQGGMLALDAYLRMERAPLGVAVLSSSLICRQEWQVLAQNRAGKRFFQSHGTLDQVLPYTRARKLEALLTGAGMQGALLDFPGGHEIPRTVGLALSEYLRSLSSGQAT